MGYRFYIVVTFGMLSFVFPEDYSGYVRAVEVSFCMDECGEYSLETEDGSFIANIISFNPINDLNEYVDRFVNITLSEEVPCVECSAFIVEDIDFSSDCEYPVECLIDPCATVSCIPEYDCYSNYCGGCYADCLPPGDDCVDFTDMDFGMCDMFLGYGWTQNGCEGFSGCGWENNGIDYSDSFFNSYQDCISSCAVNSECSDDEIAIEGMYLNVNQQPVYQDLCFNANDIAFLQEMINNSYQSGIDLDCNGSPYCGSPNPYMDDIDSWFWKTIDGGNYYFANGDGIVEPLELGIQEWDDGRLKSIMCGAYIYCQLSGPIPDSIGSLTEAEVLRFEYNYLSGNVPGAICDLDIDNDDYLQFDLMGNHLCPPYPECIENSIGFQTTDDCLLAELGDVNMDGQIDVLDIVVIVSFVLGENNPTEGEFSIADYNNDSSLDILDIVMIVSLILAND